MVLIPQPLRRPKQANAAPALGSIRKIRAVESQQQSTYQLNRDLLVGLDISPCTQRGQTNRTASKIDRGLQNPQRWNPKFGARAEQPARTEIDLPEGAAADLAAEPKLVPNPRLHPGPPRRNVPPKLGNSHRAEPKRQRLKKKTRFPLPRNLAAGAQIGAGLELEGPARRGGSRGTAASAT